MTALMRDLLRLPESVHANDFVLRLTEGVVHPEATLDGYVVTPQLAQGFEKALGLIEAAMRRQESKATYLHGSFGAGKSHFMAVLYLLLQHHPHARNKPELAPLLAKAAPWIEGKRFLLVPFHMLGASSMEAAILGGYVRYLERVHPEARPPAVFVADPILANARDLRKRMGDAAFFAALNEGNEPGSGDGWGEYSAGWDAARFEAAIGASPQDLERERLVGHLVGTLFTAHQTTATLATKGLLGLDEGLAVLSRHAKGLGYDGLILFLDELILWLASMIGDLQFVSREAQKLAKLVEAGAYPRALPIVSFIARQRDLKELIGDHVPGVERVTFADTLKWSDGRFDRITLEDRNLPVIAEKRLLVPRSEAAKAEIDAAFRKTVAVRQAVLAVLYGKEGSADTFRSVYPFSPAFIQALVALSSALQRERTALKILVNLLVNQRETLALGDLVPVGDLWDELATETAPLTDELRHAFEAAKKLYQQRLLPVLERDHGLREEEALRDPARAGAKALRNDLRLVKTLLLAALVPDVEAFQGLDAQRLAALNHGTIQSPIPGRETAVVLGKLRKLCAQCGEIRIGDDPQNPSLQIKLTGVDTDSILAKVDHVDRPGDRLAWVRAAVMRMLGVPAEANLYGRIEVRRTWRGSERSFELVYDNVRDPDCLPDDRFENRGEAWRIILDYPFDEGDYNPNDDLGRLEKLKSRMPGSRTLVWLPRFFHRDVRKDLGTLVRIDYLLGPGRLETQAGHLSAIDRDQAKGQLASQQRQLEARLHLALEAAYGIIRTADVEGCLDTSHGEVPPLTSMDPGFTPRPPVGAHLGEAFGALLDQILEYQYPAHPRFGTEIRTAKLEKVLDEVRRAAAAPDHRIEIEDKAVRKLMKDIAEPLELGKMHELPFLLGERWKDEFDRRAAGLGAPLTLGAMRRFMEEPTPRGLTRELGDLVALAYAAQSDRVVYRRGQRLAQARIGGLEDGDELRPEALPPAAEWKTAGERASACFGIVAPHLPSAAAALSLGRELANRLAAPRTALDKVVKGLRDAQRVLGLGSETPRMRSTRAALELVEVLARGEPGRLVEILARFESPVPEAVLGRAVASAELLAGVLGATQWGLVESLVELARGGDEEATDQVQRLAAATETDEWTAAAQSSLAVVLPLVREEAVRLLTRRARAAVPAAGPAAPGSSPPSPPPGPPPAPRRRRLAPQSRTVGSPEAAKSAWREIESAFKKKEDKATVILHWTVEVEDRE